ncbi:MAG: hypothetical protein ACM3MK_07275 [Chitinophagales bacterium]
MNNKGRIMDKEDFLSDGIFNKEHYEGLLVSANSDGTYSIGIQISQDKVIKVDEADPNQVRNKIYEWAPQILTIQKEYGAKADLQNYDGLQG